MRRLLSIVIPTFNRALDLDRQLGWLANEIEGFENDCHIIVANNCSTDNTKEIIQKWQQFFGSDLFQSIENARNIGGMANLALCLNSSTAKYTWTVGDDDFVREGTLAFVVRTLKENSHLALLFLNFWGRDKKTQQIIGESWFGTEIEAASSSNGKVVFQQCLGKSLGAVIFITATIYRTEFAQTALRLWADSIQNWGGQAFWTGYCGTQGSVLVTQETFMECTLGAGYWESQPKAWTLVPFRDVPEIYLKLYEIGYSYQDCRQLLLRHFKTIFEFEGIIAFLRALRNGLPRWSTIRFCIAAPKLKDREPLVSEERLVRAESQ